MILQTLKIVLQSSALLAALVLPSQATIIVTEGSGGTGNNILLQCPTGDVACEEENADNDAVLFGVLNNSELFVQFTGNVAVKPGGMGQATIMSVGASTGWTSLLIDWISFESTDLAILKVVPVTSGPVEICATDQFSNVGQCFAFSGINTNAGQFFTIAPDPAEPNNQQLINTITISAAGGLKAVQQVRIGNTFNGDVTPIPEPATLSLMGAGLLLAGALRLRLKQA